MGKMVKIGDVWYPEGVRPVDKTGKIMLPDPEELEEFTGDTAPEPGEDTKADLDDDGTKTALRAKQKRAVTHSSDHGERTAVPAQAPRCPGCTRPAHPGEDWTKDNVGRLWHRQCVKEMLRALKGVK